MTHEEVETRPIISTCPRCGAQEVIGSIDTLHVAWGISHCNLCVKALKLEDQIRKLKYLMDKPLMDWREHHLLLILLGKALKALHEIDPKVVPIR